MIFHTSALSILLQIIWILPSVRAYAQPLPCSGMCWAHDPSLIQRDDGTYFRFNTNGGIFYQRSSGGIDGPWTALGQVLTSGHSIIEPAITNLWAPDVHKIGCQYVMYYSVSHINTQNSTIGYATSPTMEPGTWTDHGSAGVASHAASAGVVASPYNAIDSAVIRAGGVYYMSFGSYWTGLYLAPLTADATAPLPGPATNIEQLPAGGSRAGEASFAYLYTPPGSDTAYYYLFWSQGQANDYDRSRPAAGSGGEYKVRVCRSTSVTGPYADASSVSCLRGGGETVLASHGVVYGPGAQGIIDDAQGPIIYYRYANLSRSLDSGSYQWGYNYLSWPSGWPVVSDEVFTYSYSLNAPATYTNTLCPSSTALVSTSATAPSSVPVPSSVFDVAPTSSTTALVSSSPTVPSSALDIAPSSSTTALVSTSFTIPISVVDVVPTSSSSTKVLVSTSSAISTSISDVAPTSALPTTLAPSPSAPSCSVTVILYVETSTVWVSAGDAATSAGDPDGIGSDSGGTWATAISSLGESIPAYGCIAVTSTTRLG